MLFFGGIFFDPKKTVRKSSKKDTSLNSIVAQNSLASVGSSAYLPQSVTIFIEPTSIARISKLLILVEIC